MSRKAGLAGMAAMILALLMMQGCQGVSVPDVPDTMPEIVSTSQEAGADFAELEVSVLHPERVEDCGFYIEKDGVNKLIKYFSASLMRTEATKSSEGGEVGVFSALASPLEPDCDYTVKAFITNGINEIYSRPVSFRTASEGDPARPRSGYTDLSAAGCANCYIVPKAGYYSFKATVKGCSVEPLASTPAAARVLWESFGTSEKPAVGAIVREVAVDAGGTVSFYAPGRDGNAVIAALDANGRILWSWHIWSCMDYDPVGTCAILARNAGTLMDRNLGATGVQPGTAGALGLMYQWGRKDPFPGSSEVNDSIVAQSTVIWPTPVLSDPKTITMSEAEAIPMTYIKGSIKQNGEVRYVSDASWSGIKGKNDPCPPGWRVPDGGGANLWSLASNYTGIKASAGTWDDARKGADLSRALGAESGCWYQATGYFNMSYMLIKVGECGVWWTCTPSSDRPADIANVFYISDGVAKTGNYNMSCACAVRCCKE